jgi:coenzyme F420-reducing hydrogenase beta subunit
MPDIEQVIASGMCVGCGTCAHARPDLYTIEMTPAGHWNAKSKGLEQDPSLSRLCPMSGDSRNETQIAAQLYPELPEDSQIGRYRGTFAAHVAEGDFRAAGGSGGLVSWILAELFRRGDIDAVLHVKPADPPHNDGLLFHYAVSDSAQEMLGGAKSRYYPIEMSGVLAALKGSSKRFAVVGLPCFIKAIRLLQDEGVLRRENTPYCLGLVCGHLKSHYFAEYLAWQKNVEPGSLSSFDFRRKLMDRRASDYGFAYRSDSDTGVDAEKVWPMASVRGRDWGEGLFKNAACEYCDDVLAECADVAIGDAWLPDYIADPLGTNVVVTRHPHIDQIIKDGAKRGALVLGPADVQAVIQSQSSGLRHRREGLSHRLAQRKRLGKWVPVKRVEPALAPTRHRRKIYDARLEIAEQSAALFGAVRQAKQPLENFELQVAPLVARYKKASLGESRRGLKNLAKRIVHRLRAIWSRN